MDEEEKLLKERKRENSVGEIIEDTFRDKSLAATFGESTTHEEQKENVPLEVEPSPSKRKGEGEKANEVAEHQNTVEGGTSGRLASKDRRWQIPTSLPPVHSSSAQ